MYQLRTSAGYRVETANVEEVAAALAGQLGRSQDGGEVRWVVTTPHGTTLSAAVPARPEPGPQPDPVGRIEQAHALLVRDLLDNRKDLFQARSLHTHDSG